MLFNKRKRISRLEAIEYKCDHIIGLIAVLRTEIRQQEDIDVLISKMHDAAKSMLQSCKTEREQALHELAKTVRRK